MPNASPRRRVAWIGSLDHRGRDARGRLGHDNPSGLDNTVGVPACVHTTATLTLALPKTGLRRTAEVGGLHLAVIGVPPTVYQRFGAKVPALFARATIIAVPTVQAEPEERDP